MKSLGPMCFPRVHVEYKELMHFILLNTEERDSSIHLWKLDFFNCFINFLVVPTGVSFFFFHGYSVAGEKGHGGEGVAFSSHKRIPGEGFCRANPRLHFFLSSRDQLVLTSSPL